jgi:hypothetical protein
VPPQHPVRDGTVLSVVSLIASRYHIEQWWMAYIIEQWWMAYIIEQWWMAYIWPDAKAEGLETP